MTVLLLMPTLKVLVLISILALCACAKSPPRPIDKAQTDNPTTNTILSDAYALLGTPYRYGGISPSGMDCSGLIYHVFSGSNITLPRTTSAQSQVGLVIPKTNARPGDLIFFKTSGSRISHVGLVSKVNGSELRFIHASESKGVIISSSENMYWKPRFVKVMRVLNSD